MMNIPDKNNRNRTSLWQLEKMKTIIAERWEEVWKIVTTRDCYNCYVNYEGAPEDDNS